MNTLIEFIIGLVLLVLLGFFVRPFLKAVIAEPTAPEGLKEEDWKKIVERSPGGAWIGLFERIISLVAFWDVQHTIVIIGAWLAFKVAAKWEVWKNVVQVPNTLEGVQDLKWYQARNALGSWLLVRFLVGTLVNVLIGALAAYAGLHSSEIIKAIYYK